MAYVLLLLLAATVVGILYVWAREAESYGSSPHVAVYSGGDRDEKSSVIAIPKCIWSYWHSESKPQVATRCLENWRALNPEFQINMLHAGNILDFVSARELPENFHQLVHQHQADWLRLALLEQYGGIWLDSSIFLTTSLDWMIAEQVKTGSDYIGFETDKWRVQENARPVIENWCMAAIKDSQFIRVWLEEFTVALKDGPAYLADLKAKGIYNETIQKIIRPQYFLMHVCAQRVLQKSSGWKLCLIKGAASAFFYHTKSDGRLPRLFGRLLFLRAPEAVPALIKLRGRERRKLEKFLRYGIYRRQSIVGLYLVKGKIFTAP